MMSEDDEDDFTNSEDPNDRICPSGDPAIDEIKYYQRSTRRLIPEQSFADLVQELIHDIKPDFDVTDEASLVLQEMTESYLVGMFSDSNLANIHGTYTNWEDVRKRFSMWPKDIQLARRLRGEKD